MSSTSTENTISMAEAAKHPALLRDGEPVTRQTVWNYAKRGAKAAHGGRVTLETVRTPSGVMTTRQAVARFAAAVRGGPVQAGDVLTDSAAAARDERLRKQGLL